MYFPPIEVSGEIRPLQSPEIIFTLKLIFYVGVRSWLDP